MLEGITTWNAIRIIQNEKGMKLKTDDPTFTTTEVVTLPPTMKDTDAWIYWLFAHNCRQAQTTSSYGDLKGLVDQSHINRIYLFLRVVSSVQFKLKNFNLFLKTDLQSHLW